MECYLQLGPFLIDADWPKGTNSAVPALMYLDTERHQVGSGSELRLLLCSFSVHAEGDHPKIGMYDLPGARQGITCICG